MWFRTYLNTHSPKNYVYKALQERGLIITNSITNNSAALYSLKQPS